MGFAVVLAAALALGLAVFQAVRTARRAAADFDPHPVTFVLPSPIPRHELITLHSTNGDSIAASFVAPTNGIAVIVGHGAPGSRAELWSEVSLLARAGFGVLAIDWPGHGESSGKLALGAPERAAFGSAVDFLASREDVKRIGAFGFSNGGSMVVLGAAADPRVHAVLAVNAWADVREQVFHEHARWGPLRQYPAWWSSSRFIDGGGARAIDAAPKLRGRPSLGAARDEMVPPDSARRLAEAAGGQWRLVPAARHLDVRARMSDWEQVLVGFFERTP